MHYDATPSSQQRPTPNRVLMVSNFLSPNGTSRGACEELADQLAGAGWEVITTSEKSHRIRRLADMVSTVWRRRAQYDVAQIDVYSGSAFIWAEAVCAVLKSLGKPYVLSLHGGGLPQFACQHPKRVSRLLRGAAVVTTPSNYLLERMSSYRSDLTLMPNSLDIRHYQFRHRTNPQPNLIWLRSIHRIYNPVQAVQVLASICQDHPQARLNMVGPDKGDGSRQAVEREAERLGVMDRLTFTGVVPKADVPRQLAQADIFLNSANIDNTPISVIEALACGLCVVSTDVGGIPYLLDDQHDSLLTPPRQPDQMAAAVCRILDEPGLAGLLSGNARRKTEQFDWSVTLPAWQQILETAYHQN